MKRTFDQVLHLVLKGEVVVSEHGYDEMAQDGIFVRDVVGGLKEGKIVEDYPAYPKGPCVLVLEKDRSGNPIHVVWGIPKGKNSPAVVVTAYRPDPRRWTGDFMRRKT
jgi:hypothetical protein